MVIIVLNRSPNVNTWNKMFYFIYNITNFFPILMGEFITIVSMVNVKFRGLLLASSAPLNVVAFLAYQPYYSDETVLIRRQHQK